jgi:hypothetical protein
MNHAVFKVTSNTIHQDFGSTMIGKAMGSLQSVTLLQLQSPSGVPEIATLAKNARLQ